MRDVRDSRGNWISVCENCRDEYYTYCDECEEYWPNDCVSYIDGSRLIPSFRVKQMMEHYAPSVEQTGWYGVVRWCAEDVIAAAEQNGVTLTEVQAEKWLEKNERWFKEMLTEYGNEVLASASKESFEEVCKA